MGHRQEMTKEQRVAWDIKQYKAALEAKRGHNYTYWNDDKHDKLFDKGWKMYMFPRLRDTKVTESDSTFSEYIALETRKELIANGYQVKLFCGYHKNIQRIKTFSILYKIKKNET